MSAVALWLLVLAYALVWRGAQSYKRADGSTWPATGGQPVGLLASLDPRGGGLGGLVAAGRGKRAGKAA